MVALHPHDYDALNDFLCWHADAFSAALDLWRQRNLGESSCFKLARLDAQARFPLEGEEVAQMDAYISSRFGKPVPTREPDGRPLPVMVVS